MDRHIPVSAALVIQRFLNWVLMFPFFILYLPYIDLHHVWEILHNFKKLVESTCWLWQKQTSCPPNYFHCASEHTAGFYLLAIQVVKSCPVMGSSLGIMGIAGPERLPCTQRTVAFMYLLVRDRVQCIRTAYPQRESLCAAWKRLLMTKLRWPGWQPRPDAAKQTNQTHQMMGSQSTSPQKDVKDRNAVTSCTHTTIAVERAIEKTARAVTKFYFRPGVLIGLHISSSSTWQCCHHHVTDEETEAQRVKCKVQGSLDTLS